jgi:hypothetical protein
MTKTRNTEKKKMEPFVFNRGGYKYAGDEEEREPNMWMTSYDVFKGYRYRKQHTRVNPNTGKTMVYQPYIPVAESSNHEFALTFPQWEKVIQTYFDVIREHLTKAILVQLPKELGILEMCRVKKKLNPNAKKPMFLNLATMGFSPKMIWMRYQEKNFRHKMWYVFNLSRRYQWSYVGKALKKDPSIIFKWNNLA